jgi:hypothetical protein
MRVKGFGGCERLCSDSSALSKPLPLSPNPSLSRSLANHCAQGCRGLHGSASGRLEEGGTGLWGVAARPPEEASAIGSWRRSRVGIFGEREAARGAVRPAAGADHVEGMGRERGGERRERGTERRGKREGESGVRWFCMLSERGIHPSRGDSCNAETGSLDIDPHMGHACSTPRGAPDLSLLPAAAPATSGYSPCGMVHHDRAYALSLRLASNPSLLTHRHQLPQPRQSCLTQTPQPSPRPPAKIFKTLKLD